MTYWAPPTLAADARAGRRVGWALTEWLNTTVPVGKRGWLPSGSYDVTDGGIKSEGRMIAGHYRLTSRLYATEPVKLVQFSEDGPCGLAFLYIDGGKPEAWGYNPDYEAKHGVSVFGAKGGFMRAVQIEHTYGDPVYFGERVYTTREQARYGRKLSPPTRDVLLADARLHDAGRQLCSIVAGSNITVERVTVGLGHSGVFDVEANNLSAVLENLRFADVTVKAHPLKSKLALLLAAKGRARRIAGLTLERVRCEFPWHVVAGGAAERKGLRIDDVRYEGDQELETSGGVVVISGWADAHVTGCRQPLPRSRKQPGVKFVNMRGGYSATGNDFPGAVSEWAAA